MRHDSQRGQVLVIVAAGMIALVAAVGLVIDGGHLWSRQRDTQNGTDASAQAGAIALVNLLRGEMEAAAAGPAVCAAVEATAADNSIEVETAYYTTLAGDRIALAIDTTGTCHSVPPCPTGCAGSYASGVEVNGITTPETILMQIVGFNEVDIRTTATAISGYVPHPCISAMGCTVLPLAPPVTVTVCNRTNRSVTEDVDPADGTPDLYQRSTEIVTLPFCRTGAGSVGWLDFDGGGGGASEIEDNIRNPTWVWPGPDWYQIAQTGDVNSAPVENAINELTNSTVFLPMFSGFCSHDPDPDPCPEDDDAGGTDIWYFIPQLAAFQLVDPREPDGVPPRSAWITGNDADLRAICGEVSESGATSCLTGRFVDFITDGEVGAAPEGGGAALSTYYGIQLIR